MTVKNSEALKKVEDVKSSDELKTREALKNRDVKVNEDVRVRRDISATRRAVELEFEVPGTPEQVWHAIATGPGISSWLFPTEVEERVGGAVAFHIAPGMESAGVVTAFEPPRRFAYEEPEWNPPAPPLGTEFLIEARAGGTCVVRMVHSLFTSKEDWDDQFDGFEAGWVSFFDVLRTYLRHFSGMPCSPIRLMNKTDAATETDAWEQVQRALGLDGVMKGSRQQTSGPGVPRLAGLVERVGHRKHLYEVMLRLDEPAPGIALAGAYKWGGSVHAAVSLYLYGERGAAAIARDEPAWKAWMERHFPAAKG
jgi:uncharacterized protein YndB with AHSA1/START domain